ncbi:epoxide hydrolase family protein [Streptomyces sp. 769]|uniref:epoxide hydrolase family protein n=1 Tax=Streptomyces sp. 769 TaxID=1262452 RepID=UPI00057CF3B4|nr:epoxide hydrolase family protein [Streptomyces sp. 769]AJC53570.1 epoxide hydrolase [Streptomyces sp. 769]
MSADTASGQVTPFRIDIPSAALADLHERLDRTRWPDDEMPGIGWSQGVPPAYLRDLATSWRHAYDWRPHEAELNKLPQFTTEIDGANLHFIHARAPRSHTLPVVLMHGWPGSILEHTALVEPLTADGHDVVVLSLPGFGFSGPTRAPGWDIVRIAHAGAELMRRLGYDRYALHGSDWGAMIAREWGRLHPDQVARIHVTTLLSAAATAEPTEQEAAGLTEAEIVRMRASAARRARNQREEMGYGILQSTRPQTLGFALTDSLVGQLAWILEKFKAFSDCRESPEEVIDRGTLLTNVMVYWLTGTATSSARLYYETAHAGTGFAGATEPSSTPTGLASFPADTSVPVRHLAERTDNIVHWTEFPRGGHFPGLETPDLLLTDLRTFLRNLR